jgi:hypothetical protein
MRKKPEHEALRVGTFGERMLLPGVILVRGLYQPA